MSHHQRWVRTGEGMSHWREGDGVGPCHVTGAEVRGGLGHFTLPVLGLGEAVAVMLPAQGYIQGSANESWGEYKENGFKGMSESRT